MVKAKKRFGQNFLHDDYVIERIINSFAARPDDLVYEIGPGQGALTQYLIKQTQNLNVIEVDKDMITILKQKFKDNENIQIHQLDALKLVLPTQNCRIIGNLPYNISSPILINFLYQTESISDMLFMLQKEVVKRICSPSGQKSFGRLSVMMQYGFECEALFDVKPESFDPVPKVDSQIIRLTKRTNPPTVDLPTLEKTVKQSFAQKRKTIKNNLKKVFTEAQLLEINIDPKARPEALSVDDFVAIANHIQLSS